MPTIQGTHGPVSITLLGVADVAKMLFEVTDNIAVLSDEQLIRSSAYVVNELQESIMGNRAEPRSVDTGNFANSIHIMPVAGYSTTKEVSIHTDVEYAGFLEFGTSKLPARHHFQNTALRVEPKLKEDFNMMIKKVCDKNK